MDFKENASVNLVIVSLGAALVVFFIGVSVVLAVTGSAPTEMWAAGGAVSGALVGYLVPPPSQQTAAHVASATASNAVQDAAVEAAQEQAEQPDLNAPERAKAEEALQNVKDLSATIQASTLMSASGLEPADAAKAGAQNALLMISGLASAAPADDQSGARVYRAAAAQAVSSEQAATATGSTAGAVAAASGAGAIPTTMKVLMGVFLLLLAVGIGMSFIPSEGDQLIREGAKTVLALASSAGGALIGLLAPSSPKTSGQ